MGNDNPGLLNEVDLSSIHVLRASHQLTPAPWAQPIIVTPETPLLIAGQNSNRRIAALSFDLHDSDLPLQPAFPVLIYNLVNWFLPAPVAGDGQVAPDTPVTIQPWPGADHITITGPGVQPVTVAPPFPATTFNQTDKTGIYTVTQHVQNQNCYGAFVINLFDPVQSSLAPAAQLPIARSTSFDSGGPAVPRVLREIWPWIAAFLLLVLCAEWWLFSHSYTLHKAPAERSGSSSAINGRLQQRQQLGAIATILHQVEVQYKTVMKRLTKRIKRMGSKQKRRKLI